MGQVCSLGSLPKAVGQLQKILLFVKSWACTSSPITVSYFIGIPFYNYQLQIFLIHFHIIINKKNQIINLTRLFILRYRFWLIKNQCTCQNKAVSRKTVSKLDKWRRIIYLYREMEEQNVKRYCA
jgi:hypothetical protein